jgi:hypothetical protein
MVTSRQKMPESLPQIGGAGGGAVVVYSLNMTDGRTSR